MFKNSHVGRPSNLELRNRKIKKILIYGVPILIVVIGIALLSSGSLSNLMGNSVTTYYCEDSTYTLDGTKCTKIIKEKAHLLGDINSDEKINTRDAMLTARYVNKNKEFNEFEIAAMDVNKDGNIDAQDYQIIYNYASEQNMTENGSMYELGEELVCPSDYKLDGKYCTKTIAVDAKKKIEESKETKTEDLKGTFIIEFNSNGAYSLTSPQEIVYGKETAIKKHNFLEIGEYKNNTFLYWNVYNKTLNKWLCYNKNKEEEYLDKKQCDINKDNYVHLSDGAIVSTIAQPGETVILYAQWGKPISLYFEDYNPFTKIGNSYSQKIRYDNKSVKLEKNKYVREGYEFVGWKVEGPVLDNSDYGYLCYTNSKKNDYSFMTKKECQKNGQVILKDEQSVTVGKEVMHNCRLYTVWEKSKNIISDNLSVSINDPADIGFDRAGLYTDSKDVINFYNFDNEDDLKIPINTNFYLSGSKKYYYKWLTYRYDTLSYESNCLEAKPGTLTTTLDLNLGIRKGKFVFYSDSKCNNSIKQIETRSYKLHGFTEGEVSIKQVIPSMATTINSQNGSVSNTNNLNVNNVYYPYNTKLTFKIDFNVYNKTRDYYYKWKNYGAYGYSEISNCTKIPKSGSATEKINIGKGYTRGKPEEYYWQAEVDIYTDSKCNYSYNSKNRKSTKKYKLQTFNVKYDSNGGTGANKQRKIVYNNNDKTIYADNLKRDGYDFVGYRVKNSKGQYICYKNSSRNSQGYFDVSTCQKNGYVIYYKDDILSRTTSNNGEILTFIAQWTNNPVTVSVGKLNETWLNEGNVVHIPVSFKINDKENTYYYKWGYLKLNTNMKYSDSEFKKVTEKYDWNLRSSACRKVTNSSSFTPQLTVERTYNAGLILIYKDSSCSKKIESEKNVSKYTEIYKCKDCKYSAR